MDRALNSMRFRGSFSCLILEEIHRVTGVMPEQMVGPAPGFAFGIHVRTAEEKRLDDQMLQFEFASLDLFMNPLVARVETACMTAHCGQSGFFLNSENTFRIGQRVCDRDLDLDMLRS